MGELLENCGPWKLRELWIICGRNMPELYKNYGDLESYVKNVDKLQDTGKWDMYNENPSPIGIHC